MKSPEAKQALKDYLLRLPAETRKSLRAITPEALGQSLLLHISTDNMLEGFSPYITRRTVEGEDRSVPRICTAPSLMGCIMGYVNDVSDFLERPTSTTAQGRKVPFKGGWVIYGLPFDYALRPGDALLPGVDRTDEHWLVNYDQFTADYKPVRVGKFFYERVEYHSTNGAPESVLSIVVEVASGMELFVTRGLTLQSGYWRMQVRGIERSKSWAKINFNRVQEISEAEYFTLKGAVANLLSFDNPIPPSQRWTPQNAS